MELIRYSSKGYKRQKYRISNKGVLFSFKRPLMQVADMTHILLGKASQIFEFEMMRNARNHLVDHCFTVRDEQHNALHFGAETFTQRRLFISWIVDSLKSHSSLQLSDINRIKNQTKKVGVNEIVEIVLRQPQNINNEKSNQQTKHTCSKPLSTQLQELSLYDEDRALYHAHAMRSGDECQNQVQKEIDGLKEKLRLIEEQQQSQKESDATLQSRNTHLRGKVQDLEHNIKTQNSAIAELEKANARLIERWTGVLSKRAQNVQRAQLNMNIKHIQKPNYEKMRSDIHFLKESEGTEKYRKHVEHPAQIRTATETRVEELAERIQQSLKAALKEISAIREYK